ncbi:hypothetical protein CPter291_1391 [Collimonas pratensis]|uniref:Uncharacterized protein n=1 Tax=Collimonas pratensis TaxID=279113 RepID=A0ABN4M612_9BURK|nr:hypothetical protein CPter291_1391 [Collimonas pratensis]
MDGIIRISVYARRLGLESAMPDAPERDLFQLGTMIFFERHRMRAQKFRFANLAVIVNSK